jgi:hypothetical protein
VTIGFRAWSQDGIDRKLSHMPEQPAKPTSGSRKKRRWARGFVVSGAVALAVVWFGPGVWQWLTIPADAPVIGVSYDTAWHAQLASYQ